MKKKIYLLIFIEYFVCTNQIFAQADISLATHWYNKANYNPAFIARTDYIYLFSNIRKQWVGVKGAPMVGNLQGSMFVEPINSAFGLSFVSDQIGASTAINPMFSYAYLISDDNDNRFAMGLSLGIFSRYTDVTKLVPLSTFDPSLYNKMETILSPDANVGVEFNGNHFTLGASATHLFSIAKKDNVYMNTTHYYGYAIYKNRDLSFMNYLVGSQVVSRKNLFVVEGNILTTFVNRDEDKEYFDFGLTYRSTKQLTAMVGFPITSNLKIGYAYDQTFTHGYDANPTHEILLEFRIPSELSSSSGNSGCKICKEQRSFWYH